MVPCCKTEKSARMKAPIGSRNHPTWDTSMSLVKFTAKSEPIRNFDKLM